MKIKILLWSIGAIVILILVSFTSVIGVQSTTSDSVKNSPLFYIRTYKATNNENNGIITPNYLGKGLDAIPFPLRDNRTAIIQKIIERIRAMDDSAFKKFVEEFVCYLYNNKFSNVDIKQIVSNLYLIKESNEKVQVLVGNNNGEITIKDTSILCSITTKIPFIFCVILHSFIDIIAVFFILIIWILVPTTAGMCGYSVDFCPMPDY